VEARSFFLDVGGHVVSQFVTNGLKRIGAAILRGAKQPSEVRPIEEREATSWAQVMVSARFHGVNSAELKVTKLILRQSTATVELCAPDGSAYSVELELVDGLMALAEVSRTYPD
jgi:hypothetical protein